jgi:hypothetical protein
MNDEIIQELHAVKDALAAKFNADLRLIFADIKRGEKELQAAGFVLAQPPANLPDPAGTALQRSRLAIGKAFSRVS